MTEGDARNNQRVTNALLQRDIEDISKKLDVLPDMKEKLHGIDKQLAVVCTDVDNNKEEISDLRKRSNINDIIIATGTIVAGIVSSVFGGRQ